VADIPLEAWMGELSQRQCLNFPDLFALGSSLETLKEFFGLSPFFLINFITKDNLLRLLGSWINLVGVGFFSTLW